MNIVHKESLEYYDCELLFEAEDDTGRKYLAIHDDDYETGCRYVVVPVNKNSLTRFKAGLIDLRTIMMSHDEQLWYRTDINIDSTTITLTEQTSAISESDVLPEVDYFIGGLETSTSARRFAIDRGRPAIVVNVSGTVETDAHEIPSDSLLRIFGRITASLKQLVLQDNPKAQQRVHQLNMVAGPAPGSFEILMASPVQTGMLGQDDLVTAFEKLTAFINTDFDNQIGDAEFELYNSKTLKEFQRTTQAVISSGTDMAIDWSAGRSGKSGTAKMTNEEARKIASKLATVKRLKTTTIVLEGRLDAINVSSRSWSIVTDTEGKRSGRIEKDGPTLEGRTTGARYRITCDQTVDEMADETVKPTFIARDIQELRGPEDASDNDTSRLGSSKQFEMEL